MSFAVSSESGGYEYSGSGLSGLFGQKRNALRPRHYQMLADIRRFFRLRNAPLSDEHRDMSLGEFLCAGRFSQAFIEDHIVPMGAAIWSTPAHQITEFPLKSFLTFFENHGLLQVRGRPQWRTVTGGSQGYVGRLLSDADLNVRSDQPVRQVRKGVDGVTITFGDGRTARHDRVVLACHSDEALGLLAEPDSRERALLGAIRYSENEAVLHTDPVVMPRRRRLWSAWNFIRDGQRSGQDGSRRGSDQVPMVSYWMNRLQPLACETDLFVTLNPTRPIRERDVLYRTSYMHPLFDRKAHEAQQQLWSLQGRGGVWFCGAYFGAGFHEDGLQAGLAVAEQLGGVRRPWTVANESGRIFVSDTESVSTAQPESVS